MKISIKGFIYHKEAETFADCFDRYGVNPGTNKFCVSDGVSKSFFPGLWAEILVESFLKTKGRINIDSKDTIKSLQGDWEKKIIDIVNRPNQKYYVRNFFAQGRSAAATFIGLNFFEEDTKLKWESFALGDSFLFFVPRYATNIAADFSDVIHLSSKKNFEFDNFPDYFDSRESLGRGKIRQTKHELEEGVFYLMTDALSEWFIEQKQGAVDEINSWTSQDTYENRITELRKIGLQNDDSAILIIELENDASRNLNYGDITIFKLPQDGLEFSEIEKSIEEDATISISNKFIQIDDEDDRVERDQQMLEKKLEREQHIESMVEVFEKKISETRKQGKKKKTNKSLWRKITNFFSTSDDEDDENDTYDNHRNPNDKTTAGDVNSISDKF